VIRVAVSVLNHNGAESTIACVQSLLAAEQAAAETCELVVHVADNASGETEQHQLRRSLGDVSNVHFHVNDRNLGFSAGHNRNLAAIFSDYSPDYVWLLNNDCLVDEGALLALVQCARRDQSVGIWGATLLEPDGETIQCAGGCFYNSWVSSYRQYGRGKPVTQIERLAPREFDYIAGASLFFPVATLHSGLRPVPGAAAGGDEEIRQWLNEAFFLYFEELDLANRLKHGLQMGWCRGARITHAAGASTSTGDGQTSPMAEYQSTLSALKFTGLYYNRRLWLMAPARYLAKCLLLIFRRDFLLIGAMTRAYREFWRS
jgi:GT2 family glycosyltransferase